ncbi:MAG TPA: XRE family transcriptional regulator [Polyangiaceae bacterium]|nr:XRE family transcriptional regulator [Polyangiaceae bacterium]
MSPRAKKEPARNAAKRDLAAELAAKIRTERAQRGLSLEQLAERARVSRSMLSAVERGEKVPTVVVLDRIATGLDTTLSRLLAEEVRPHVIVLRRAEQRVAVDPSGWERRILSPVLPGVEFELMRTTLGPRVDAGTFLPHAKGSHEYVAVERGELTLTIDRAEHVLATGDSAFYPGDCLHGFNNVRAQPCVYYLAMDVAPTKAHHVLTRHE